MLQSVRLTTVRNDPGLDRPFQTDARAELARPQVGIASDALGSRPPRRRPVATSGLETRLATILEPHDLRARHRLRPDSDPHEMKVHLASFLCHGMETAGVEPAPPRCKRGALPPELHPQDADGWSRTTTARGGGVTARWARRCPASTKEERGDRPDSNRYREAHNLGCSPLHHGHHEWRGRPGSNRQPLA